MREKLIDVFCAVLGAEPDYRNEEAIHFVDELIASGVTVQKWISVKDRLPEKDIRVLVWMKDNEEDYTQMDTDRWSCTMEQGYHWIRWGKSVTHWMPLPEPPKGE